MLLILGIVVLVVGGGVLAYVFMKNNPNKVKKIENVVKEIKK